MENHGHQGGGVSSHMDGNAASPQLLIDSARLRSDESDGGVTRLRWDVKDAIPTPQAPRPSISTTHEEQANLLADISDSEERSIAFADADGWRCFYPASRGHLTAAEARAEMRAARGLPAETQEEWEAAEFLLVMESAWFHGENRELLSTDPG